jgi:antitoxin component YwqK of YwqJK toxin-antitoxin module
MEIEIRREYSFNGDLEHENTFIKNSNIVHGLQKSWYSNGNKEHEFYCYFNKWSDIHQYWGIDGERRYIKTYKNDEKHGIDIYFNYIR